MKLIKTTPLDEIAELMEALKAIDYETWESVQGPLRKALDKHNDIMLALPFERPLREELADWLYGEPVAFTTQSSLDLLRNAINGVWTLLRGTPSIGHTVPLYAVLEREDFDWEKMG